jgi:hypothetical protein
MTGTWSARATPKCSYFEYVNSVFGQLTVTHLAHTDQACISADYQHDIIGRATRQPKERRLQISVKGEC